MSVDVHRQGGRDPHDVLGVPRGADRQQVVRAFRRKARHGGHPDAGGDAQKFEEIVRARDTLLNQPGPAAHESDRRTTHVTTPPKAAPHPATSQPRETSKLAIATVVLALLGPFLWPVAIVTGHVALRQIKRTGQGGGTLVPILLLFLYIITLPVLARILSVLLIP
jgi:curved DNA-binding protein CbpA